MYYKMFKKLIELGRTDELEERITVLYVANKITREQLDELLSKLQEVTNNG